MSHQVFYRGQGLDLPGETQVADIRRLQAILESMQTPTHWDVSSQTLHIGSPLEGKTVLIGLADSDADPLAGELSQRLRSGGARVRMQKEGGQIHAGEDPSNTAYLALSLDRGDQGVGEIQRPPSFFSPRRLMKEIAFSLQERLRITELPSRHVPWPQGLGRIPACRLILRTDLPDPALAETIYLAFLRFFGGYGFSDGLTSPYGDESVKAFKPRLLPRPEPVPEPIPEPLSEPKPEPLAQKPAQVSIPEVIASPRPSPPPPQVEQEPEPEQEEDRVVRESKRKSEKKPLRGKPASWDDVVAHSGGPPPKVRPAAPESKKSPPYRPKGGHVVEENGQYYLKQGGKLMPISAKAAQILMNQETESEPSTKKKQADKGSSPQGYRQPPPNKEFRTPPSNWTPKK